MACKQKRRLAVAIQLLSMPKVIFLDEPTSGLDATSSMELLQHLRCVAASGRLVVLTIHQPRLEIFHMFDRILLLCQGEVSKLNMLITLCEKYYLIYLVSHVNSCVYLISNKRETGSRNKKMIDFV